MDQHEAANLSATLGGGELVVHYQPIVSAESGVPRAVEALARWCDVEGRVQSADWLYSRARGNPGVLQAIDRAVLARALDDRLTFPLLGALKLSINLDRNSLALKSVRAFVDSCAGREGGPIAVEVFEHLSPTQLEAMPAVAEELADAGIEVWHDDFGTGERTLEHLVALPSTVAKLCPELCRDGTSSARVRLHVRSVITMLQSLGKIVIADGAADAATAEWLIEAGADWLQGWHFAQPMIAADTAEWLRTWEPRAA